MLDIVTIAAAAFVATICPQSRYDTYDVVSAASALNSAHKATLGTQQGESEY